jgi:VCBS repeat-containing protein
VVTVANGSLLDFETATSHNIIVKAADASGAFTTQTFSIAVTNVNEAPSAVADAATAAEAGGVSNGTAGINPTGNVLTNDTDVDAGDTKTVQGVAAGTPSGPLSSGIGPVTGNFGTLTLNANGAYSYALDNNNAAVEALRTSAQTLKDVFTYTMRDTAGLTSTATLTVTIQGADDTPVAVADVATAVEAGGINNGAAGVNPTGNVLTNDTDVDSVANGETKAVTTTGTFTGAHGTLTLNANGTYSYAVNNNDSAVQALKNSAQTLTDTFNYTTTDAAGSTASATLTVTVQGANDAPAVHAASSASFNANQGTPAAIDPMITVSDVDTPTLAKATVAISAGAANEDVLAATTTGTSITANYNSAIHTLTLSGVDTLAHYQQVLANVTFNTTSQQNGTRTIAWTADDGTASGNLSAVATTSMDIRGRINPPPHHGDDDHSGHDDGHFGHSEHSGDNHSNSVTNVGSGDSFRYGDSTGTEFYVVHGDVRVLSNSNNFVSFQVQLGALEAPLGGDVVSVTAGLADGKPLPSWLRFDPNTGTFSGKPPEGMVASLQPDQQSNDQILTGSIPDDQGQTTAMTIEVTVRDVQGNVSVMTFVINLAPSHTNLDKGNQMERQGWNRSFDPHGRLAWLANPDAVEKMVSDAEEIVLNEKNGSLAPLGRAGLSDRLNSFGWGAMSTQRMALLESLRTRGSHLH